MRVTNNLIYSQSFDGINKANERYLDIQKKINEQTRIVTPSDDPVGAGQVMRYEASNMLLKQYDDNMTLATNQLEYEEVTIDSINDLLNQVNVLMIQAENSANSQQDLNSIVQEAELMMKSVADLMNSKSSDGTYIFSGLDSDSPAFQVQSDGSYAFVGDEGQRFAQVAETISVPISDSGKKMFQEVWTRNTFSSTAGGGGSVSSRVSDQGAFDTFIAANYDPIPANAANNQFTVTTAAGAPDQFTITGASGVLATGDYVSGEPIVFQGMEITLSGAVGASVAITLDKPTRNNVLNEIQNTLNTLKDSTTTTEERAAALRNATVSISNTQESMGSTRSAVGARLNTISKLGSYSETTKLSNKTAQDDIAGLDIAEAASELAQTEAAISAAQQLFARVSNLSLFNSL